jgi:hypothetical protein
MLRAGCVQQTTQQTACADLRVAAASEYALALARSIRVAFPCHRRRPRACVRACVRHGASRCVTVRAKCPTSSGWYHSPVL